MILATSGLIAIYLVWTWGRMFSVVVENVGDKPKEFAIALAVGTLTVAFQGAMIVLVARILNALVV